jgi:hypothetical protein
MSDPEEIWRSEDAGLERLLQAALSPTPQQEAALFARLMAATRQEQMVEEQRAWRSFADIMTRLGSAVGQIVEKAAFQPLWMTSLSTAHG